MNWHAGSQKMQNTKGKELQSNGSLPISPVLGHIK